jgi:hypothetical protein
MRRQAEITIDAEGRDKGKTFVLTEMYADEGEAFAIELMLHWVRAGIDIPPDVVGAGFEGLALYFQTNPAMILGMLGNISMADARPLLEQIMNCVRIKETLAVRDLTRDDIEEVKTRFFLRGEVLKLNMGFS